MGLIRTLSPVVASQIAAGEVIQRPASVVKELVENAIDAGSTKVELVVKDAGRTLLQVTDDGCGMDPEDALQCFARHATSKITSADDLYSLHTKGFRGEALASIASIAHVELHTRTESSELGTHLLMEGAECKLNEACSCAKGTTFRVRNLFFNVPARRNFLKSDNVEFSHILDEFLRIVLATPDVAFTLYHNDKQIYDLPKSGLKQRIINVYGKSYNEKLLPLQQESQIVRMEGFLGKPAAARKTKGEQFLFVNGRYFRHSYFHHAITSALEEVLPSDHHPTYFIYFEIDPSKIDVNVHPTKIEVKFQEEKLIYPFLRAAVRHTVGMFNISSNIDFENVSPLDFSMVPSGGTPKPPGISYNPQYNPFEPKTFAKSAPKPYEEKPSPFRTQVSDSWQQIYETLQENTVQAAEESEVQLALPVTENTEGEAAATSSYPPVFQLENAYIVTQDASGLLLIDQEAASERVLYERFVRQMDRKEPSPVQQLLFPESVSLSPQDAETVKDLLKEFKGMGFDMEPFGRHVMVVRGVPADLLEQPIQKIFEQLLEAYKCNQVSMKWGRRNNLAGSMARTMSVKKGKPLTAVEMQEIVRQLALCETPAVAPGGAKVFVRFAPAEIQKLFNEGRKV